MILKTGEEVTLAIDGSIVFRDGLSKAEWYEVHRRLMHTKSHATAWIKTSEKYAVDNYGIADTAKAIAEIERDLFGVRIEKPNLNPTDKSRTYLSIDGISARFVLWERKMHDEVETWDKDKLTRALDLLEPMERQAKRVRELLGGESNHACDYQILGSSKRTGIRNA